MIYAQLDINNICNGVSWLFGETPEYNYQENKTFNPLTNQFELGEPIFVSRMIQIPVYSENYIGLRYNEDGTWSEVTA